MKYCFKYKRKFFKKTITAVGHKYISEMDRMDVYHENGSITSIPKWSECYLFLETDWVLFTKNQMEKESGQQINLNVGK